MVLSEKIAINIPPNSRLNIAISANQAKITLIKILIPLFFPPSISALNSIFRQNKVLIGKGTELVLLSYNDMTVLDLQVTYKIFLISVHFSIFYSCTALLPMHHYIEDEKIFLAVLVAKAGSGFALW
jgi:hypothetical protein